MKKRKDYRPADIPGPQPVSRAVYETGRGRLCPSCGRGLEQCQCPSGPNAPIPDKITCVLRIEKKGRGGKVVTVVGGLPENAEFLGSLASELKRACGTGGAAADGAVEIQGDQRERLRPLLASRGFRVKG